MFTEILIIIIAATFILSFILDRIRKRKDRIDREIEDAHVDAYIKSNRQKA